MAFGRDLALELGFALRTIDVGGGLGIPYGDGESPLDLADLGAGLAGLDRAVGRATRSLPGRRSSSSRAGSSSGRPAST